VTNGGIRVPNGGNSTPTADRSSRLSIGSKPPEDTVVSDLFYRHYCGKELLDCITTMAMPSTCCLSRF